MKKGSSKGSSLKGEKKKKDSLKIYFFCCHEFGHYVNDFPQRNKNENKGKKKMIASKSGN